MAGVTPAAPRIGLIHATPLAIGPIAEAFERQWPQARRMNLLDDSLSRDRAEAEALTPGLTQRFVELARYAQGTGCAGILFTCSAFGPAIEAAARATGLPTLKPNEAMFDEALAVVPRGAVRRLGLVATFNASIGSMTEELEALARRRDLAVDIASVFVPEAMGDLAAGRVDDHHRKVVEAAATLADCDAVMLAQFSMADAAPHARQHLPCPVLSSPDCAVLELKRRMLHD